MLGREKHYRASITLEISQKMKRCLYVVIVINEFFHQLFKVSCSKMYECLNDNGILVIFFPHFSIDARDFLINSLLKANFRITAAWSIYPKNVSPSTAPSSLVPLIIIVARKCISAQSGYIEKEEC